ncbi:hypothetical protein [Clostridium senegalense]
MSRETPYLKLYEYDPTQDQDSTFNIDNALNNNWDKIDSETQTQNSRLNTIDGNLKGAIKIIRNVTLTSSTWTLNSSSGLYEYTYSNSNITNTSIVDVNIQLNSLENASTVKSATDSYTGYVKLYATEKPTNNIICDIRITKEVV